MGAALISVLRSRTEPPPDLADTLRELDVLDSFRAMWPAVQRELVAYVEKAEREGTRRKYIARVVERACAEPRNGSTPRRVDVEAPSAVGLRVARRLCNGRR